MTDIETLILGIDGGGSKTAALLATRSKSGLGRADDEQNTPLPPIAGWNIIGTGHGGPSNLRAVGLERAVDSLDTAIATAFANAKIARQPVRVACFGLAGVGREPDRKAIEDWSAGNRIANENLVLNDAETIVRGGTQPWGVVLICGTGSMAFGLNRIGESARAGGWGHILGDEGSGYAIAADGLRAVANAADGRGRSTTLVEKMLQALRIESPQEMVSRVYSPDFDKSQMAALAEVVFVEAERDDAVANAIVDRAANDLANAVIAVCHALRFENGKAVPLSLTGGVIVRQQILASRLQSRLLSSNQRLQPISIVAEPARHALHVAARRADSQ